jgi:superfamily II DNA/RNA helicase
MLYGLLVECHTLLQEEVDAFRVQAMITCRGVDIPKPILTFEEAKFPGYVMKTLMSEKFEAPTPIQSQGWPMAMSGRNTIGVAQTGSGKTLSFILPGIVHINHQPLLERGEGPIVLVLVGDRLPLILQLSCLNVLTQTIQFCPSILHLFGCACEHSPKILLILPNRGVLLSQDGGLLAHSPWNC